MSQDAAADEILLRETEERWSKYVNVSNSLKQARLELCLIGDNEDVVQTLIEIEALIAARMLATGRVCDVIAERLGYDMSDDDDDEPLPFTAWVLGEKPE
jgi:hypothetical protein